MTSSDCTPDDGHGDPAVGGHDGADRFVRQAVGVWLGLVLALYGLILLDTAQGDPDFSDLYAALHDFPAAWLGVAGVALVLLAAKRPDLVPRLRAKPSDRLLVGGCSLGLAVLCYVGAKLYFAVTMDEVMADFDASIFRQGRLLAEVAPEWRPYVPALQWQFRMEVPGNAYWASLYLPGNAAIRGLFDWLGDRDLSAPFWMASSLVLIYVIARRLWPEQRAAALAATALLATSSQAIVGAMTPFSMPAHLTFNLAWLWCFLRRDRLGHAGAAVTGFIATGLHQLLFHPLFAAPFVLELWIARRWRPAVGYTVLYAAIGLFWLLYWDVVLPGTPTDRGRDLGVERWILEAWALVHASHASRLPWMVENVFRFVLWQSLLAAPLALLSFRQVRRDPTVRPLILGIVLTLVTMAVLVPNQGFGWGYRYLHGFIGSVCLLAVFAWLKAVEGSSARQAGVAWGAFGVSIAFSALLLTPLRLVQTYQHVTPYARAHAAIRRSTADVVVIDPAGLAEAIVLPRNDPFLNSRPKVMLLGALQPREIRTLCRDYTVELFDRSVGARYGMLLMQPSPNPQRLERRRLLQRLSCATTRVGG